MKTRVQKWGNSLALRIPKPLAIEVGLENNSSVELRLEDGKLVIVPQTEPVLRLEDLLEKVTEQNLHREVNTGYPMGDETW